MNLSQRSWKDFMLGVAQGSVLRLFSCDTFLGGLFFSMKETDFTSCADDSMSHKPANTTDEVIQSLELNKEKYIGKYVLLTQTIVIAPSFGCFIAVLQIIHSMRSNIRRQNVRRRKICFSTYQEFANFFYGNG